MELKKAIEKRYSVRGYLDKSVDKDTVKNILEVAKKAPSGVNSQPWKVYVVMGNVRDNLVKEACEKFDKGEMEKEEYQVQLEHREVLDYALNTLGIVDPRYLWIAQLGWRAPLPSEDWIVCKDTLDDQERVYYYDTVNDISQWEHPLDQHFRDQVKGEKQKLFDAVSRVQGRWRGIKQRRRRSETPFLYHLYIKTIILPRQARDKHKEKSKKDGVFP